MSQSQSLRFPFMLNYESKLNLTATSYNVSTNSGITFDTFKTSGNDVRNQKTYPFEALDWSTSVAPDFKAACILYYDNNKIAQIPLDMIINKTAINNIANFYNTQDSTIRNNLAEYRNNYFIDINNTYDLIKVIKHLKSTDLLATDIYNKFNNSIYSNMYNDKDSNVEYAKKIYRAAPLHSIEVNGLYTNQIIPIFKVINNTASDLKAYINIRNFKIPMKIIKTSAHDNKYNYIFIYPEYIIENYKQYRDSIKYIEFNYSVDKIYYSYVDETVENKTVWCPKTTENVEVEYTVLGNTFSSKTLNFIYY